MLDIQVIDDPAAATVALGPMRSRLLSELVAPASAATLATRVGLARQKVNYHLHALEAYGLVRLAQERKWGGLTERLLVATAASYVVSSVALGPVASNPNRKSTGCPRVRSSPWAHGCPRGGRSCSSRERGGQTSGDPGGGYRGSLPVGGGPGGFQQRTHRGHHKVTEARCGDVELRPGHESRSVVTAWDPPRMFAAQGEGWGGSPPIADEWSVEARAGGICVVRVVHSLFASTDDWETSWKAPNPAGLASPHPADLSHALPRPTLRDDAVDCSRRGNRSRGLGNADRGIGAEGVSAGELGPPRQAFRR